MDDVFTDPQVVNNEIIVDWEHPDAGLMKMAKPPVRWDTTKPETIWTTDHLGQSTENVLSEFGFSEDQITQLKEKNIILKS